MLCNMSQMKYLESFIKAGQSSQLHTLSDNVHEKCEFVNGTVFCPPHWYAVTVRMHEALHDGELVKYTNR